MRSFSFSRWTALLCALLLAAAGLTTLPSVTSVAHADPTPPTAGIPATVTADGLPTVQINGVVWSQAVVGNTVFAGGSFSSARPARSPLGTNETPRTNLLAYNLTTGALITSFDPVINAQVTIVRGSPDGKTVYVGGDFTSVNGVGQYRIAAFDVATGSLLPFSAGTDARVNAIVPTANAIYIGGYFSNVNGVARERLAAVAPMSGNLLGWAPTADYVVQSMVATPDGSKIVIGGAFANINSGSAEGIGAVDATTGASLTWNTNAVISNYGLNSGIYELTADNDTVYGAAWNFAQTPGFEGAFAISPANGSIVWLADCHGDTYSVYSSGSAVYTASHHHDCSNIGGFPTTDPLTQSRANAFSKAVTGVVQTNHEIAPYYANYAGEPATSLLQWYPNVNEGTYTGESQGPWDVTGSGPYVVMGGEFTQVNGIGQQGLVRYATLPAAPGKIGPTLFGYATDPTVSVVNNQVSVNWTANSDEDSEQLTYQVIKNYNHTTPMATVVANSNFWTTPALSAIDTAAVPGQTNYYAISATDPQGNTVFSNYVPFTVPSTVMPPPPTPVPSFTDTVSGASVSFNASASTDVNGTIASYSWAFGDGGTATGITPAHTYTAKGTYTVTLAITDVRGATATATGQVVITAIVGPNLLIDPGAESIAGSNGWTSIASPPGWTTTGQLGAVSYTAGNGFPSASTPGPTNRGANFFSGGNVASSTASQTLSLAGTTVASGNLSAQLSGWFGGYSSKADAATLTATFVNAAGTSLGTITLAPVTPAQRGNVTEFLFEQSPNTLIPATTTSVIVTLTATRASATTNDGYADNLAFNLVS